MLSPEDWHTMVNNLQQSHAKLVGLVRSFDRSRLHEPLYENDTSAFEHFLGSIQHNTYHAGQTRC